jgi:catalase-peroxidase
MGLIYVNPEGPGGNPDPLQSARDIKETFERMAMNHEETVALTAGGHTFGKAHGNGASEPARRGARRRDIASAGLRLDQQPRKRRHRRHTVTSGIEGAWVNTRPSGRRTTSACCSTTSTNWCKSPAGAHQWQPIDQIRKTWPRHARIPSSVPTMMTTADMALKMDPEFRVISEKVPQRSRAAFKDAFARAWFKLCHRDMGPKARYLGPEVPAEDLIWQDPVPAGTMPSDADVAA